MSQNKPSSQRGYEARDASPRSIVVTAVGLAVGIILTLVASAWIYVAHYRGRPTLPSLGAAATLSAGTSERTSVQQSWLDLEHDTQMHLGSYAWRDREKGIVQIPVERAMELIAREGEPKEANADRQASDQLVNRTTGVQP